jgi:hypothetical protein
MNDPLTNLEDAKAQHDIGVFAYRIYTGTRDEGASLLDALIVVAAWFYAVLKDSHDGGEGGK